MLEGKLGPSFSADPRRAGVLSPRIWWTMNPPAARLTLVEHKYR